MAMKRITIDELREIAKAAAGKIDKIYLHWTAGNYHQFYYDYHLMIDNDGAIIASTDDLTEVKDHTWRRNSRSIGIAMCCCVDAKCWADGRVDFGSVPPTPEQIDGMSQAVAAICKEMKLPIVDNVVMTHCEAAEKDCYGPSTTCERWDLWKLPDIPGDGKIKPGGDVIRGKAIWFQNN